MLKWKLRYFGHLIQRANLLEKTLMLGQDRRQEEKGTTEKMIGWHHWLNGYEFEQALGDGEGQGSLACYSPWGRKESDTTEWLNNSKNSVHLCQVFGVFSHITWSLSHSVKTCESRLLTRTLSPPQKCRFIEKSPPKKCKFVEEGILEREVA